jgi:pilus assembly protein CpaB
MSYRGLLFVLGLLCLVTGLGLSVLWFGQEDPSTTVADGDKKVLRPAILVTTRAIDAGALILPSDMRWKEVQEGTPGGGMLVRGQVSEADFAAAITRRGFAHDEPLVLEDLVKAGDRKFLAAILGPGKRAVAVPVEAQQSASGLVLPGDRVDVILTHVLVEAAGSTSSSVAETVLRDVRVIAVDQALAAAPKPTSAELGPLADSRMPRAVTLEVDERQAQTLVVALQLGKLQLSLRSLQRLPQTTTQREPLPTFAADISPALRQLALKTREQQPSVSSIESSVRRPPTADRR